MLRCNYGERVSLIIEHGREHDGWFITMIKIFKCKKEDFGKIKEGKKIICFGAGEEFRKVCQEYSIEKDVWCIIDNNMSGHIMVYNNINIPIVSMNESPQISEKYLYLITTIAYADQIVLQLDEMHKFDNIAFFVPYFFETNDQHEIMVDCNNQKIIPQKIHYCWFGKGEIPDRFKKNIETWYTFCPDYEIIRWDENNYDITKNRYMQQAYEKKKWGFVPDYARLDIVNTYGGIYLDTDVEIIKSWDSLLQHQFFCGFESDEYVALGLGFGSMPNNKILNEMLSQYDELEFVKADGSLNLTPSPVYQTEILKHYGLVCNGKTQINDSFAVYSPNAFAPVNSVGVGRPTESSYSIHQYAATWCDTEVLEKKKRTMQSLAFVQKRIFTFEW